MRPVLYYGVALFLMAMLSLVFGTLSGKASATASCGFAKNLRKDMYFSIQDFSFADIDKFSTSSLVTRLTTDVTNVQNAFQMIIRYSEKAERNAPENINLNIQSGETIGIIGGTGSAKTTLIQLIPRLHDATAGTVLVGGKISGFGTVEEMRENNTIYKEIYNSQMKGGK